MLPNSNTNLFFSHTNRLGLEQPSTSSSTTCKRAERKTAAARPGLEWSGVTVLREHPTTPRVKCMYCGDEFTAGATLIRKHMLDKCTCDTRTRFACTRTSSTLSTTRSKARRGC